MTYREAIYMVLDQARLVSDDITLNEEHVLFLLDKVRALLLTQKYKSAKLEVSEANYQMLCIYLKETNPTWMECDGPVLRSTKKLPKRLNIGNDIVSPFNFFRGIHINLISRERMRYVGHNKFMGNIIYCSIGPDGYLYVTSKNPQFGLLHRVKFTGVFESGADASELLCDSNCNIMDREFPMEEALVTPLIEAVVKEMVGAEYRPKDDRNNANDDTSKLVATNGKRVNTVGV